MLEFAVIYLFIATVMDDGWSSKRCYLGTMGSVLDWAGGYEWKRWLFLRGAVKCVV